MQSTSVAKRAAQTRKHMRERKVPQASWQKPDLGFLLPRARFWVSALRKGSSASTEYFCVGITTSFVLYSSTFCWFSVSLSSFCSLIHNDYPSASHSTTCLPPSSTLLPHLPIPRLHLDPTHSNPFHTLVLVYTFSFSLSQHPPSLPLSIHKPYIPTVDPEKNLHLIRAYSIIS